MIDLDNETTQLPDITLEEVNICVKKMKTNKSPGLDSIPTEQYKASDTAVIELHHLIRKIWDIEQMPDNFVLANHSLSLIVMTMILCYSASKHAVL